MSTTQADLNALRTRIKGDVVLPEEEAFAAARLAWNLSVDQRPVAVVFPESADDMVEIVRFAGENGLRSPSTAAATRADHLGRPRFARKTYRMRKVDIDPVARRARVEAGVLADELATAAGEHGLAYLAGTSPGRRCRRLHARRRHQLVGAQAGLADQQRHGARRGHRRRPARAHGRRQRARPLLGDSRRRAATSPRWWRSSASSSSCPRSTPAASSGRSSARPRS